ncbi:Swarming motility protein SwrC [Vibrio mediterranei]|uniref:efflux RND transporter permease subunit n=1 Tax=Vibrio mediterranei TaxID=689 RepID=UPI0007848E90|nr:efflux RND transporter permease subunit [Vibrio mediterranei]SBO12653.1 Swarming motility protein SwrC [Vibrio mediterranei]
MFSLISYFAQRPFLARIITIMVLMMGVISLYTLKLQEYPDVAFESAEVTTHYPGATASDVEVNVTNPLEKELRTVKGINFFSSQSVDGFSAIELEFLPDVDSTQVMRDIQQAVDRVSGLPKDITNPPLVTQKQTSSFSVLSFGISAVGETQGNGELQEYAYHLERAISALSGVQTVTLSGYSEREFWVEIDPTKASRYQLTFAEISNAIVQSNLSQSGGMVRAKNSEQKLITMTQVQSAQEIGNIVIKALPSGTIVKVSDVAQVIDTFAKATQQGVINGQDAVLFDISNSGNADITKTVASIKALLEQEQTTYQGQFVFQYGMNLADDMSNRFTIVSTNGAIGLLLVLLVLSMVLKRQVAFWVSISIPFCILGVMIVLPMLGLNLDSITLAALLLVIGIIVDDSVIVAESIYQQKEAGKQGVEAAIEGTKAVIKPILASLTTTALVFIPMVFIPGIMGKVIVVIPITVITALLFSLGECTFTLPAHLSGSLESKRATSGKFTKVAGWYQRMLTKCLRYKKSVITAVIVVALAGMSLVMTLKLDIFPSQAAKYVEVHTEVKPGTSLENVRVMHARIEQAIKSLPVDELESFEMTYQSPVSTGRINLSDYSQRKRTADEIVAELNRKVASYSDQVFVKFSIDAGGPPPGEPIEVRVLGGLEHDRQQAVELVSKWLAEHSGLANVTNSEALKDPQLKIVPQHTWLAKYGLTVADLANTLRIAFDGEKITSTWLSTREVDIRMILNEDYRSLEKLATTKIYTSDGKQVPLSRLARVEQIDSPRLIKHYNGQREVTVTAQITDDALSSVALSNELLTELQGKYAATVTIDIGGEAEKTNETMSGFIVAFPSAMVAIYFVLAIMFNSLLQPLLVMAVIPFAVVASLMALVVHFQALSLFALIGVLGMTGVVVNNALVLINRINELRADGNCGVDAVIEASVSRLRPILLTSLTTVVGLLPLAYGIGGTDVYMGPMSLTLGYGLLFSLPIVLLVVPVLYSLCFVREREPMNI